MRRLICVLRGHRIDEFSAYGDDAGEYGICGRCRREVFSNIAYR